MRGFRFQWSQAPKSSLKCLLIQFLAHERVEIILMITCNGAGVLQITLVIPFGWKDIYLCIHLAYNLTNACLLQDVEPFTAHYVFALGIARFLSCAHWVLQVFTNFPISPRVSLFCTLKLLLFTFIMFAVLLDLSYVHYLVLVVSCRRNLKRTFTAWFLMWRNLENKSDIVLLY